MLLLSTSKVTENAFKQKIVLQLLPDFNVFPHMLIHLQTCTRDYAGDAQFLCKCKFLPKYPKKGFATFICCYCSCCWDAHTCGVSFAFCFCHCHCQNLLNTFVNIYIDSSFLVVYFFYKKNFLFFYLFFFVVYHEVSLQATHKICFKYFGAA